MWRVNSGQKLLKIELQFAKMTLLQYVECRIFIQESLGKVMNTFLCKKQTQHSNKIQNTLQTKLKL